LSPIGSLYGFDHGRRTVHARRAVLSRGGSIADIFDGRPICRFQGAVWTYGWLSGAFAVTRFCVGDGCSRNGFAMAFYPRWPGALDVWSISFIISGWLWVAVLPPALPNA
jgi:hypothetical protein